MQRCSGAERIIEMNGREGRDTRGFVMALVITGGTLEEAGRSCEGFHGAHPYCHGPFSTLVLSIGGSRRQCL